MIRLPRLLRFALCAFCVFHMVAVLAINLPTTSAFGNALQRPFYPYMNLAGIWQSWAMFDSRPRYVSYHPTLVARWADGSFSTHEALLPGLTRYRANTRLSSLFIRYVWQTHDYAPYVQGYLQHGCRAVAKKTGKTPEELALRLSSRTLVDIARIKATGKTYESRVDYSPVTVRCR